MYKNGNKRVGVTHQHVSVGGEHALAFFRNTQKQIKLRIYCKQDSQATQNTSKIVNDTIFEIYKNSFNLFWLGGSTPKDSPGGAPPQTPRFYRCKVPQTHK